MPTPGGDAFTGTDAGEVIGIHPKLGSADAALGTDAGEVIFQTGPYEPAPDSSGGVTELSRIAVSATSSPATAGAADTGSGAESQSVATFVTVAIGSADSSRLPPTTPADTDAGGAQSTGAEAASLQVTLSSADTGTGHDGK